MVKNLIPSSHLRKKEKSKRTKITQLSKPTFMCNIMKIHPWLLGENPAFGRTDTHTQVNLKILPPGCKPVVDQQEKRNLGPVKVVTLERVVR